MQTSPRDRNTVDRLFGWWYAIAAPSDTLATRIALRNRVPLRKARYISLVLLIEIMNSLLTCYLAQDLQLFISVSISIVVLCIGVFLNRKGKTLAAGILVVATLEVNMSAFFLKNDFTGNTLSLVLLPWFIILLQPQLIAVSLFPPLVSLLIGVYNSLFIAAVIFFSPKTPEMLYYLSATNGGAIYFVPIGNLIIATLISLLWVNSASREMKRADYSEQVSQLAQEILRDPELLAQFLRRLERSQQRRPYEPDPNEPWGW